MDTNRPETHILNQKYIELTRKNQEPTRKCAIYPNMDPKYSDPTRNIKEPKKIWVLIGTRKMDPNRPGSDQNRPVTDPNFLKYLCWSKTPGSKGSGSRKTRSEPDPRTWMPMPNLNPVVLQCNLNWFSFSVRFSSGLSEVVTLLCFCRTVDERESNWIQREEEE